MEQFTSSYRQLRLEGDLPVAARVLWYNESANSLTFDPSTVLSVCSALKVPFDIHLFHVSEAKTWLFGRGESSHCIRNDPTWISVLLSRQLLLCDSFVGISSEAVPTRDYEEDGLTAYRWILWDWFAAASASSEEDESPLPVAYYLSSWSGGKHFLRCNVAGTWKWILSCCRRCVLLSSFFNHCLSLLVSMISIVSLMILCVFCGSWLLCVLFLTAAADLASDQFTLYHRDRMEQMICGLTSQQISQRMLHRWVTSAKVVRSPSESAAYVLNARETHVINSVEKSERPIGTLTRVRQRGH